jgi:hypothetical protein
MMLSITQDPHPIADYLGFAKGGHTYFGSQITNLSSYKRCCYYNILFTE